VASGRTGKSHDRRLNLMDRDVDLLAALAERGPIPMSDLFWEFFATEQERAERGTRKPDRKKGDVRLRKLEAQSLITIGDLPRADREGVGECSRPECPRPVKGLGMCAGHYRRHLLKLPLDEPPLGERRLKVCAITPAGRTLLRVFAQADATR
jgi:hypothetical protein